MRNRLASIAVILVCLFVVSGCADPFFDVWGDSATPIPQPTTVLSGSSWKLTQLFKDGMSQPLAPTTPVTLQFQRSDGAYIGSSGCNYYSGAYIVSGERLTFKFKSVTQVACVGPIMSQEVSYLNAMQLVRSYQFNVNKLTLKDGQGAVILTYASA